jgi:hypothetical protein
MRCFSLTCKTLHPKENPRFMENGWTEVVEDDLAVAVLKQRAASAVAASASASAATARADHDGLDMLVALLDEEEEAEEEDAMAQAQDLWKTAAVPAQQAEWMRRALGGPRTLRQLCPLTATLPPCIGPLIALRRATVRLHASLPEGLPFCPRWFVGDPPRFQPHAVRVMLRTPPTVLVVEERDPRCAGRSYRLFVLCPHPECAHLHRAGRVGGWVELTRPMAAVLGRSKSNK